MRPGPLLRIPLRGDSPQRDSPRTRRRADRHTTLSPPPSTASPFGSTGGCRGLSPVGITGKSFLPGMDPEVEDRCDSTEYSQRYNRPSGALMHLDRPAGLSCARVHPESDVSTPHENSPNSRPRSASPGEAMGIDLVPAGRSPRSVLAKVKRNIITHCLPGMDEEEEEPEARKSTEYLRGYTREGTFLPQHERPAGLSLAESRKHVRGQHHSPGPEDEMSPPLWSESPRQQPLAERWAWTTSPPPSPGQLSPLGLRDASSPPSGVWSPSSPPRRPPEPISPPSPPERPAGVPSAAALDLRMGGHHFPKPASQTAGVVDVDANMPSSTVPQPEHMQSERLPQSLDRLRVLWETWAQEAAHAVAAGEEPPAPPAFTLMNGSQIDYVVEAAGFGVVALIRGWSNQKSKNNSLKATVDWLEDELSKSQEDICRLQDALDRVMEAGGVGDEDRIRELEALLLQHKIGGDGREERIRELEAMLLKYSQQAAALAMQPPPVPMMQFPQQMPVMPMPVMPMPVMPQFPASDPKRKNVEDSEDHLETHDYSVCECAEEWWRLQQEINQMRATAISAPDRGGLPRRLRMQRKEQRLYGRHFPPLRNRGLPLGQAVHAVAEECDALFKDLHGGIGLITVHGEGKGQGQGTPLQFGLFGAPESREADYVVTGSPYGLNGSVLPHVWVTEEMVHHPVDPTLTQMEVLAANFQQVFRQPGARITLMQRRPLEMCIQADTYEEALAAGIAVVSEVHPMWGSFTGVHDDVPPHAVTWRFLENFGPFEKFKPVPVGMLKDPWLVTDLGSNRARLFYPRSPMSDEVEVLVMEGDLDAVAEYAMIQSATAANR